MKETESKLAGGQKRTSETDASRSPRGKQFLISTLAALGAGLAASLMAVLLMSLLRLMAGIPTPVELFGDHVLKLLPAAKFVDFLVSFGKNAKTAPLGLALLGMIGAGTVLGLVYAILVRLSLPAAGYRPARREYLAAAGLALVMTLAGVVLFWGELGQNFLGLPQSWAMLITIVALLADFSLYGVVLCVAYRALVPKVHSEGIAAQRQGRRQLLARTGVAAISLGAAAGTVGTIRSFLNNFTSYDGMSAYDHNGFTPPITPNSEHYVVTQNVVDPAPSLSVWRLEITGLVGNAGSYTLEEVKHLPSTSRPITLECISNGPGGHLISTAIWQGVTLRTLLERHGGAQAGARYVAFYSVDGYSASLPLNEVLAVDPLLAWQMNGAELPQRHGYPLRVLIPGRYGEENPKWVTKIELTDHFVGSLYADQGWYNGPLHTTNRIDRPRGTLSLGHVIEVGGIAFAGARGVQKVEVSVDGGSTWNTATLQSPLSQDTWVLWTWQWTPLLPGQYTLEARVTAGTGEVQTATKQGSVPQGATGYHEVKVQVS